MNQLSNLTIIFNKRLFRIPDYQRGYAWLPRQLQDFWEDLVSLEEGKSHYTGVLTLEEVSDEKYKEWHEDLWLIEKGYTPYFVVDGQQRLTTCIILIQAIIDVALTLPENREDNKDDFELNYTSIRDIRREFIFLKKTGTILRSYVFGYEKDNPSYEFLKTRIFGETSSSNQNLETLYTHNLENAKQFFIDNLLAFKENERLDKLQSIYKKVTQHLTFNDYIIQDDIDVFVAFETMNNRGKKLSDLELLKNRLIYLSTLYKINEKEKITLRSQVNDCWKEVYYQLGRSKTNPLNDDDFLKAHWTMYFKYSRNTGKDYSNFLLNEQFSPKKVLETIPITIKVKEAKEIRDDEDFEEEDVGGVEDSSEVFLQSKLSTSEVADYAQSLQDSGKHWFNSFNPINNQDLTEEEQLWLDRLNRIGINYFRPLVMSSFLNKVVTSDDRIKLFQAIERFIFLGFRLSQAKANTGSSEYYGASRDLYLQKTSVDEVIKSLEKRLAFTFNKDGSFKPSSFQSYIDNKFDYYEPYNGYYGWSAIRYFLYEYEIHLFNKSRNQTQKIDWNKFVNKKDWVSIEHILPQNYYALKDSKKNECWSEFTEKYDWSDFTTLTNSLGNLLALSQPKNSMMQNDCYENKRADKKSTKGYFNGSYSEIRVAELYENWTPETIKERGLELLKFMEERWNISLGDKEAKIKLLHLSFLDK